MIYTVVKGTSIVQQDQCLDPAAAQWINIVSMIAPPYRTCPIPQSEGLFIDCGVRNRRLCAYGGLPAEDVKVTDCARHFLANQRESFDKYLAAECWHPLPACCILGSCLSSTKSALWMAAGRKYGSKCYISESRQAGVEIIAGMANNVGLLVADYHGPCMT